MNAEMRKVKAMSLEEEMQTLSESMAARVQVAIDRMRKMRLDEAEAVLLELKDTLPEPKEHNLRAAEIVADRGIL